MHQRLLKTWASKEVEQEPRADRGFPAAESGHGRPEVRPLPASGHDGPAGETINTHRPWWRTPIRGTVSRH
jgi:hypothetical protein